MAGDHDLTLYEELMLLSLRDKEGTLEFGANWNLAVAGAIVAELMFLGHVAVIQERRRTFLEVANARPPEDLLLAHCLERVRVSRRRESIPTWVSRFANIKNLKDRVAGGLCRKRILKEDEATVLLLFRRKIYPEIDPVPEQDLRERMRRAIFTERGAVEARTAVTIALADACSILPRLFDKNDLKDHRPRLEAIARGDLVSDAAREAITAAEAAVMMLILIPTVISTTGTATG
ncbi:GPP34 family phosphoprotein [bacterium]|mgnify:CR=1 FL=1|nr:GPP34 family phosphoprotein [bacterium]HPF35337.1 GPP34 family phosphoprotein [Candidatus Krumholzibacteria bacterium]HRX50536.1 GPP34 family phosphoprotein [Candidatus Krumholzibacteria bacterium]